MEHKIKKKFIFGLQPLLEAVKSGEELQKVLLKKGSQGPLFQELLTELSRNEIPFQFVPIERLNRVTSKNHQGAIAFLSPIEYHKIETIIPTLYEQGKDPFVLILDGITDVRNFGAIARSAECAGVHAIIIPDKNSAEINADAIRSSAGALFKIHVCRHKNFSSAVQFLKESGLKLIAATEKADSKYFNEELIGPIAIILGSEEKGIRKNILNDVDSIVKIPMMGEISSLNVGVATGILLFEVVRQRSL